MMKTIKCLAALMLVFTLCSAFSFKKKEPKQVYVMGLSFSFKDSVVYVTEIQEMPGVKLTKDGFLPYRDDYSYQLRNYLESIDGDKNHTCVTYFGEDKAKLTKKTTALTRKFVIIHGAMLRTLSKNEFQYARPEDVYDN